MIISFVYVFVLYIIIDLSSEPETNLPSFKTHRQYTDELCSFNIWTGYLFSILKSSYFLLSVIISPKLLMSTMNASVSSSVIL